MSFVILASILIYLWHRLVRGTGLRGTERIAATVALLALVLPMGWLMATTSGVPTTNSVFAWPTFLGWAVFAFLFLGLVAADLGRVIVWVGRLIARRPASTHRAHRQRVARITGAVVTAAVLGYLGYGMTRAFGEPEIVDVTVTLHRLPHELDGFTIVQLTDLHVGGTLGRSFVEDVVRRTNAIGADMIVLTGDFVDGTVEELHDEVAPLADLRAPYGVFFVTGNHEYYFDADAWLAHLRSLGIRVLHNERAAITRHGAAFELVGIDDHSAAGRAPGHGPDLERALAGRDPQRVVVLLAHQPRQVRMAVVHGVDLQLSGHTHGGQLWPWHYLAKRQQGGLLGGRYRVGATQLYVSRGPGYWGPPVRVAAPPEITRVILRSAPT